MTKFFWGFVIFSLTLDGNNDILLLSKESARPNTIDRRDGMRYQVNYDILTKDTKIDREFSKIVENLRPFQFSGCWGAAAVLELRAGTVQRAGWELGQQLEWQ